MLEPSNMVFVNPMASASNFGKDVLLTDIYGLPAAFAYLAWQYSERGTLADSWPPSPKLAAAWAALVGLVAIVLPRIIDYNSL